MGKEVARRDARPQHSSSSQRGTKTAPEQDMLLQALPPDEIGASLYELAGIDGSELPEDTAFINTVLSVLPTHLAEALLVAYVNDLYT